MHAKRILMLSTLAVAIALGTQMLEKHAAKADPSSKTMNRDTASEDFLRVLGASSEDEVKEALYEGASLAEIAKRNGRDPDDVVRLQIDDLVQQMKLRLESGSITQEAFALQMEEVEEIVKKSVFGTKYSET